MFEIGDDRVKLALKFALMGNWVMAMEYYAGAMRVGISTDECAVQHEFERMAVEAGQMKQAPVQWFARNKKILDSSLIFVYT
jgi:hypothetical protein